MANLLIDIGNTTLKASWADGMTLGKTFRYQGEKKLIEEEQKRKRIKTAIKKIANVMQTLETEVMQKLKTSKTLPTKHRLPTNNQPPNQAPKPSSVAKES